MSGIFKSTTISRTFECTTNNHTAEVQAHNLLELLKFPEKQGQVLLLNGPIFFTFAHIRGLHR